MGIAVIYVSLRKSPYLAEVPLVPGWVGNYLDNHENSRHLIGYTALAGICGWTFCRGKGGRSWLVLWCLLGLLALLLETAQMALPDRHADWRDVAWSWAGSAVGAVLAWVIGDRYTKA